MNKPVAWWDGNPKNAIGISKSKDCDYWQPLYTHPVKQLSDEEIIDIWCRTNNFDSQSEEALHFARAIIKEITE